MASELALTEERQRRILAQDLHDSIGQNLALSKLRVDSMRSGTGAGKISSELESLSRNLEDAIEQIQSLIFKLSPPILYQVGLGAALEYLAEWVEETYDIRIAVNTETNCPSIPEDESVLLFRAVQELLTNTVKHAEASNSSITLRGSDDHVYIEVQDNGTGFDTGILEGKRPLKDRFGLLSIKERLQHLGGHTRVESSSGRGTKVCMWAPLRTETKNTEVIREN
jgi:signal transduction histidine kinase